MGEETRDRTALKMAELNLEAGRRSSSVWKSSLRKLPRSSSFFWRQVEGLLVPMWLGRCRRVPAVTSLYWSSDWLAASGPHR